MEKEDNHNIQNVFAKNKEGNIIHVSEAESGCKGYFCLGCHKEMQAVHPEVRQSYFRHHNQQVREEDRCKYNDETYRHEFAKKHLLHIKEVRVPAIYKYPPKGADGDPIRLTKSKMVKAHRVKLEIPYYLDVNGKLQFDSDDKQKTKLPGRFHEIRPDAVFFNQQNEPILFIEIAATHKVDAEKRIKLQHLKIDTIEISVPRSKPEDIKDVFYRTDKTKWIYSLLETNHEYVSTSYTNSGRVPSIDELQRKLFEESSSCRSTQIRNLIRSIESSLESEQYSQSENRLRKKIYRVESDIETYQDEWLVIRNRIERKVRSRYSEKSIEIEELQEGVRDKQDKLEERYFKKKRELIAEERVLDVRIEQAEKNARGSGETIEQEEARIGREKEIIERSIKNREDKLWEIEDRKAELSELFRVLPDENKAEESRAAREFGEAERKVRGRISQGLEHLQSEARREVETDERIIEAKIDGIRSRREYLPEKFESDRAALIERTARDREQLVSDFQTENISRDSTLSKRAKGLLAGRKDLNDIDEKQRAYNRYRRAKELFKEGAYKNWDDA